MFKALTFLLFAQLAVGGICSISLVPDPAGKSFFRFCGAACAILLGIALAVKEELPVFVRTAFYIVFGLQCIYVALVQLGRRPVARNVLRLAGGSGVVGLAAFGFLDTPTGWPTWTLYASAAYQVITCLFLGSVIFAMTLGHWYLVVPALPIGPLSRLTNLMIVATGFKTLLLGAVLYLGSGSSVPEIADTIAGFGRIQGLFFWARCLFGLVGPIVICCMTWSTVRLNATQAATGLLYVATILVLIGETLAGFIYHTTHLPV